MRCLSRKKRRNRGRKIGGRPERRPLGTDLNYYKHHLGDYDGATAHLSWDEDMAYTRLLRAYYRREGPIPASEVYRLVRASSRAQKAAVDSVLSEFFHQTEGAWHNKRADEEITMYQAQADTNRRIARERTVKRTVNEPSNDSSTNRPPNQNHNQEPITKTKEKHKANGSAFAPPDWIPNDAWQGFEAMRTKIRKPMTDRARKLIVGELEKLRSRGEDPVAVLEQSERNSWQDVFPLKAKSGGTPDYSAVIANIKD
jgi:uncharacterized protein YdaU (DUF1376 family)